MKRILAILAVMSGMNVSFDLLANAQVGFKLYF